MKNGFSIIVCCYNSSTRLERTLSHLAHLRIPSTIGAELIIVDNASTDDTAVVAESTWSSLGRPFQMKLLSEPESGLSYARLLGIKHSLFPYLLFCDDDNWLSDNYLEEAIRVLNMDSSIGMLGGIGNIFSEVDIPSWTKHFHILGSGKQADQIGEVRVLYGAGVILRKSAFEKLLSVGYRFLLTDRKKKKLTSGGDYELCYAIGLAGYKLWYDNSLCFRHFIPKERLEVDYVLRFLRESTGATCILDSYRYFLRKNENSQLKFYYNFTYRTLHHTRRFFTDFLRSRRAKENDDKLILRFKRKYHQYSLIYSVRFLFKARGTYKKIHILKQNLNGYSKY